MFVTLCIGKMTKGLRDPRDLANRKAVRLGSVNAFTDFSEEVHTPSNSSLSVPLFLLLLY